MIEAGEVHLWWRSLNTSEVERYEAHLSEDERERASRYAMAEHQRRFSVGRGMLRELLGRYVGDPPNTIHFVYGTQGKPEFWQAGDLRFNVAHSGDWLLIGIANGSAIGVDIEQVRPMIDMMAVARQFFSEAECNILEAARTDQQAEVFFAMWTRKEAILKATGEGITGLRRLGDSMAGYTICELDAPQGYLAALAVQGEISRITRSNW
jgi:4'-phosphopantetheinyl transferase